MYTHITHVCITKSFYYTAETHCKSTTFQYKLKKNKNEAHFGRLRNTNTTTSDFSLFPNVGYATYFHLSFKFSDQKPQTLRSVRRRGIADGGGVGRMRNGLN